MPSRAASVSAKRWRARSVLERAENLVRGSGGLTMSRLSLLVDLSSALARRVELDAARRYVEATIDAAGGNKTEAARLLGIGRNRITRLLKR